VRWGYKESFWSFCQLESFEPEEIDSDEMS